MMQDKIVKAILYGGFATVTLAKTTLLCCEAVKIHNLSPVAAHALCRTLSIVSILGTELKSSMDSLSVNINGGGGLGNIVAATDKDLNLRGLVGNPSCDALSLSAAVGNKGVLRLLRKTENSAPYVGTSSLVSGEIAEDFSAYFAASEQQPSAVGAGEKFDGNGICLVAGAYLIRILPYCPDEYINALELKAKSIKNLSIDLLNHTCEEFLKKHFGNFELEFADEFFPKYSCKCSVQSISKVLCTINKNELKSIIKADGKIEVDCHFCNKKYQFFEKDF